jgi:hypothetical protein
MDLRMNSSTSISEPSHWGRLLRRYVASTLIVGAAVVGLLLALDPYDTGRYSLLPAHGVANFGQRLAFASVARRPDVDAAIIGNSTIQLIDPARLSHLIGHKVVSLAVPGSGPVEQLALADYFRRQHPHNADLNFVFGLDQSWCTTADPITPSYPFPFWLYSNDRLDYVVNMLRYKSFEAAARRLKLLAGLDRPARADGYHDYDTGKVWHPPEFDEAPSPNRQSGGQTLASDFTALPLLQRFLASVGPKARVVLVFPPRHVSAIPAAGSAAAAELDACKNAFRRLAETRSNTWMVDFLIDSQFTRREDDFWDTIHYRGPVARAIEDRLADVLGS